MTIISSIILTALAFSIGFLAQRSRMCFIAGLRDFILVRDGELLKGLFTFVLTIWLLTSVLYGTGLINDGIPAPLFDETEAAAIEASEEKAGDSTEGAVLLVEASGDEMAAEQRAFETRLKLIGTGIIASPFLWASIIGGFILGLITTAAGGCALRQHVLAAQGHGDAKFFIFGFFTMVIIYDLFLRRIINDWF